MKLLFIIVFFTFSTILPVEAAICRTYDDDLICINTIKRSAKNYWEYRVSLNIKGEKKPLEIYNCRDKFKITKEQKIISFKKDKTGEFICNLVHKY